MVDRIGAACAAVGCILLVVMTVWTVRGTTAFSTHAVAIAGGTAGGLAGGAWCESAGLIAAVAAHVLGAAFGAAGLAGIAALAQKI